VPAERVLLPCAAASHHVRGLLQLGLPPVSTCTAQASHSCNNSSYLRSAVAAGTAGQCAAVF
jgi:hypothetical protein